LGEEPKKSYTGDEERKKKESRQEEREENMWMEGR
jgi:hypothetical protein